MCVFMRVHVRGGAHVRSGPWAVAEATWVLSREVLWVFGGGGVRL